MREGKRNMNMAFNSDATFYFLVLMIVLQQQGRKKKKQCITFSNVWDQFSHIKTHRVP